jgi:predicted TIM-barrel fold metal-dependent hydrolase
MMLVDAHHHVWRLARGDYAWLTADLPIHRDYTLDDLRPLLGDIPATVLIQAAPTSAETALMLDVARNSSGLVRGVVGWEDLAQPAIATGAWQPWADDMNRVAQETGAFCNLSGLITEAASDWLVDDLRRYVDYLLTCFGPDHLMWGSDWPVVNLAGGYPRWREASMELLAGLSPDERAAILGGTAAAFYRLPA